MAGLKSIPVSALTFLLVAFTTGKFSVLGLDEEAEIRQVRSAIEKGDTMKHKSLDYIAENRMDDPGVVVSIENYLDKELKGGENFEEYGKVKLAPPKRIDARTQEIMAFDKKSWGQGAQGIVTYKIKDSKHPIRFLIAFSVPWSHLFSRNWYGLKVIDEDVELNQKYFLKVYKKHFYDHGLTNEFAFAKSDGKCKIESGPYTITATMTKDKRAILRVKVTKNEDDD